MSCIDLWSFLQVMRKSTLEDTVILCRVLDCWPFHFFGCHCCHRRSQRGSPSPLPSGSLARSLARPLLRGWNGLQQRPSTVGQIAVEFWRFLLPTCSWAVSPLIWKLQSVPVTCGICLWINFFYTSLRQPGTRGNMSNTLQDIVFNKF